MEDHTTRLAPAFAAQRQGTQDGSFRLSVAADMLASPHTTHGRDSGTVRTFQMKEDVGLVVFEHLGHQLNVHVLDVDVLWMKMSMSPPVVRNNDCWNPYL